MKVKAGYSTPLLHVADVARTIDFYTHIGFETIDVDRHEGTIVWARMHCEGGAIMIVPQEEPQSVRHDRFLLYLYTPDLPALREQLMEAGIEVGSISYPPYMPSGEICLSDPDGFIVAVGHWGQVEHDAWLQELEKKRLEGMLPSTPEKESTDQRKVELRILIKATPQDVISAFLDPVKLAGWWHTERTLIEPKVDGMYTLAWLVSEKGIAYTSTGIIRSLRPGKELIIEKYTYLSPDRPVLGPMRLSIRTRETQEGCEVHLCQEGYQEGADWDWYYAAVQDAWPKVVETLKEYLEKPPDHSD